MSIDSPKPPREVQVDLSGLSTRQVLIRRGVITLGERAFGPRWQTYLAVAVSKETGRRIGQAQVSHWVSGHRPVPEALVEPLRRLAFRLAGDMERGAGEIRTEWAEEPPAEDVADMEGLV